MHMYGVREIMSAMMTTTTMWVTEAEARVPFAVAIMISIYLQTNRSASKIKLKFVAVPFHSADRKW